MQYRVVPTGVQRGMVMRFALLAAALAPLTAGAAQPITSDGTLGTAVQRAGSTWTITGGAQRGGNLFHSFGQFNVNGGQSATFSGPGSVTNIIGRVTGPGYSTINGTIRTRLEVGGAPTSALSTANLWLLNPRGILFGPGARLDVGGSFHASTADYLKLGTGTGAEKFHASLSATSTLTSAAPSAFGFLSASPQPIIVQGSALAAAPGKTLSLVGGELVIVEDLFGGPARITAPGGRINIASAGGPGEIATGDATLVPGAGQALGNVTLDNSELLVQGPGGTASGSIHVRAGRLELRNGGNIDVSSYGGSGAAGVADVRASGSVLIDGVNASGIASGVYAFSLAADPAGTIGIQAPAVTVGNNGTIQATARGGGAGGTINLEVGRLEVLTGGRIDAGSRSGGSGGSVNVTAGESILVDGAGTTLLTGIFARAEAAGTGGTLTIRTPRLSVSNGGLVAAYTTAEGDAGALDIEVGRLELLTAGRLDASARSTSSGQGGSVSVNANEWILADAAGTTQNTGIFARAEGTGNAGTVLVMAPHLTVSNGAKIAAYTTASGNAGVVDVEVGRLDLLAAGQLDASALKDSSGAGGTVRVKATEAIVVDGQSPTAFSGIFANTLGTGKGGTVAIRETPLVTLSNGGAIAASTFNDGVGGEVSVDAGRLNLSGASRIEASTFADGDAGKVTVRATGPILIDGLAGIPFSTGILANTSGQGKAGEISVAARALTVINGGAVSSTTTSSGDAGNVIVAVDKLTLRSGSWIMSGRLSDDAAGLAAGTGSGGTVTVTANESILIDGFHPSPALALINSSLFAGTGGAGPGGEVVVTAPAITLSNGGAIQSFTTGSGSAGPVTVNAGRLELAAGGSIDTSGGAGAGGKITVKADSVTIRGAGASNLPSSISADTSGSAPAGDISITTPLLAIADGGTIRSTTLGTGAAGSIQVAAGRVEMRDRALITVQSADGPAGGPAVAGGPGGSITIDAGRRLTMSNGSRINARTESAPAGDIRIRATELVFLSGSEISTSVAGGNGNGGNILIDPIFVVLNDSRIIANALRGNGGNITIVSDFFIPSSDSLVQASSRFGLQGEITLIAPNVDVSAGLSALPSAFFDASLLLRESCAARAGRAASSSFTGVGRGGLPASPGGMAFGSYDGAADAAAGRDTGFMLASARIGTCR